MRSLDGDELDERGFTNLPNLLDPADLKRVIRMWIDGSAFRKSIDMARYGYGSGEYRYFAYPLPEVVQRLRAELYELLVVRANAWMERLSSEIRYPLTHSEFLERCHEAGQTRPTPLLLRYTAGDYNRLHQDLYGPLAFPLQVVLLLSEPGADFEGGEFVLSEHAPRKQTRATVVPLRKGEAVVFAGSRRPMQGKHRDFAATMRHGVSEITRGERLTLGIIFHDAE